MKTILTTVLVLGVFFCTRAQFLPQKTQMINGSLGFETYKEKQKYNGTTVEGDKYTAFSFTPSYG